MGKGCCGFGRWEKVDGKWPNEIGKDAIIFSDVEDVFGVYKIIGKINDKEFSLGGITKIGGTDSYGYLEDFSIKVSPKGWRKW